MKPTNTNCQRRDDSKTNYVILVAGFILFIIPMVSLIVDPLFISLKYLSRISVGSELYRMLQQRIPGAYISVYVFNVTNSEAFLAGDDHKLKLEEVGPFTYQEFRDNNNLELDEEAGVMRYTPLAFAEFVPGQSIGDPRTINVTVTNTVMLALASMMSSYSILGRSGFNLLVDQLRSKPIIKLDVHSLLWGYEDPLITLGHSLLPGWITFKNFGVLDRLYDPSLVQRLEIGTTNADKFNIKSVDGCRGLKAWQYENPSKRTRCNSFIDTYEGFAFPPGVTPDKPLRLYRNVFCRILELEFVGTGSLDYIPETFLYKFRNDTFSINSENECLCGENGCRAGISNMSPCVFGLDIGLSFGHFLHADPKIYERLEGINPDEDKHGSRFVIDPKSGVVVDTTFTLQLNVIVRDVGYHRATRPFSEMVIPQYYLKIVQPKIPEDIVNNFKLMYLVFPHVILGIEIAVFSMSLIFLAYATRHVYWDLIFNKRLSLRTGDSKKTVNIPHLETLLVEERPPSSNMTTLQHDSNS